MLVGHAVCVGPDAQAVPGRHIRGKTGGVALRPEQVLLLHVVDLLDSSFATALRVLVQKGGGGG